MSFVKIIVFIPSLHADLMREALASSGAGKMGNYDYCSFSVKGIGRFRPLKGSEPFLGQEGEIEEVEEERIETICEEKNVKKVLEAIKKVHPYEEPAIDIIPILDFKF